MLYEISQPGTFINSFTPSRPLAREDRIQNHSKKNHLCKRGKLNSLLWAALCGKI
jgi:hypothetical protein